MNQLLLRKFWSWQVFLLVCRYAAADSRALRGSQQGVAKDIVKGISYGPMPCSTSECEIHMDDFFGEASKPLWGARGRADLQVIKSLGANSVRLYGNSPQSSHSSFLDEAHSAGLSVVAGISDYPYTQMQNNCMTTNFNCYEAIKGSYFMNLMNGFMTEDKRYHASLKEVIIINEPDLKLPGMHEPRKMAKGIISALDGMLDAEAEAGIQGPLIDFTATFSFGICSTCQNLKTYPALGQMYEIQQALLNPEEYGYTPRNDLAKFYHTRWIHSFNTNAHASFVKSAFLEPYEKHFAGIPVMIEEFHTPWKNPKDDLKEILQMAQASSVLRGVSFFEFQVRYDKGGSEMEFGMFGLGSYSVNDFEYFGSNFHSWCLVPQKTKHGAMPGLVADAFGGAGMDYESLCNPDPYKVPLTPEGFARIAANGVSDIAFFVARVIEHRGYIVMDHKNLELTSHRIARFADSSKAYNVLLQEVSNAHWVSKVPNTACVADRLADVTQISAAVDYACGQMTAWNTWNCSLIPKQCDGSIWARADVIFAHYYREYHGDALKNCYFDGAARLASTEYLGRQCRMQCCDYDGSPPRPFTVAPTLPPIFGAPSSPPVSGGGEVPPTVAGDCAFANQPPMKYFWDEACNPHGGAGCLADGSHLECRFCGQSPFPDCPRP